MAAPRVRRPIEELQRRYEHADKQPLDRLADFIAGS